VLRPLVEVISRNLTATLSLKYGKPFYPQNLWITLWTTPAVLANGAVIAIGSLH